VVSVKTLEITVEIKVVEECPNAATTGKCPGGEHRGYLVQTGDGYQGIPDEDLPEAIARTVAEVAAKGVAVIAREDPEVAKLLEAHMERATFAAETAEDAPSIAETYRAFGGGVDLDTDPVWGDGPRDLG
jgi:hypothetical protein